MAKYVFIYKGGSMPESEEEQQSVMAAWVDWLGGLGDSVVDAGNPFGASKSVWNGGASGLGGYSIVNADSLDDAAAKAQGCPILRSDSGTVEVYEALAM
jgi:hypothetical protein